MVLFYPTHFSEFTSVPSVSLSTVKLKAVVQSPFTEKLSVSSVSLSTVKLKAVVQSPFRPQRIYFQRVGNYLQRLFATQLWVRRASVKSWGIFHFASFKAGKVN